MKPIPHVTNHAQERAAMRLGRLLTRGEWNAVLLAITERRAVLLSCSERDGSEIWLAPVGTISLRLVWKPAQAVIVTILPNDTPAIHRASDSAREAGVRSSLRRVAHYRGGKLLRGGTEWNKP